MVEIWTDGVHCLEQLHVLLQFVRDAQLSVFVPSLSRNHQRVTVSVGRTLSLCTTARDWGHLSVLKLSHVIDGSVVDPCVRKSH